MVPRRPRKVKLDSRQAAIAVRGLHVSQRVLCSNIWRDRDLARGVQRFHGWLVPGKRGRVARVLKESK